MRDFAANLRNTRKTQGFLGFVVGRACTLSAFLTAATPPNKYAPQDTCESSTTSVLIRLFLDQVLDIIHFLRATRKKAPHQMCGGTYLPRLFEGISVIATQRLEFGFDGVEFVVWIGATFTPSDAILRRFVWMDKHRLVSCRVDAFIFPFVGRERSRRLSVLLHPVERLCWNGCFRMLLHPGHDFTAFLSLS